MDLNRASVISEISTTEEPSNFTFAIFFADKKKKDARFSYLSYADDESLFEDTDDINELKEKMRNLVSTIADYKAIVDREKEAIIKEMEGQKETFELQIAEQTQKVSTLQLENEKLRNVSKKK
jgi:hypothetical protein